MHEPAAPWPAYRALLAVDRTRAFNLGRRVRLAWALHRTRPYRDVVDRTVGRCPWLRPVMDRHPILFRPLLSKFLDARLGSRTAFDYYAHDLEFVSTRIEAAFPWFFPAELGATVWADPTCGYTARLAMNLAHPQEGLWRLDLCSRSGARIFTICFSVLPGPRLFVGAVQGGRSQGTTDVRDLIRLATRQFEGIRPHFLLFEVLRSVARTWGIAIIGGIAARHQLKSRARRGGRAAMHFCYDQYFSELDAVWDPDGNWSVPTSGRVRDLSAVPSRKRAMYRRRYALLDGLHADVQRRLAAYAPGSDRSSSRNCAPAIGLNTYAGTA